MLSESYDGKKFPESAPYHGVKGQMWETFVRNFAAAMSTYARWLTTRSRTPSTVWMSAASSGYRSITLVLST